MRFHPDVYTFKNILGVPPLLGYLLIKSLVLMELVFQEERHNKKQT